MEKLVEGFIMKSNRTYRKEITTTEIQNEWNINIPSGIPQNKRWDFAVRTDDNVYVIETNFYTSGGSKLNETARSYRLIAEAARNIKGFVFIWITDGNGWLSAKHNLEETFNVPDTLYNISDMENGIFNQIFSA